MRIIRNLSYNISEGNHKRCRIEFEKSRLNPGKIALVGEFYHCAIKPMMAREGSAFAKTYRDRSADQHADLLKLWIATEGIEVFRVTSALAGVPLPSYTYKSLFGADPGSIASIPEMQRQRGEKPGEYVRDANLNHARWVGYTTTYPAVRVGDMLKAMDCKMQAALEMREWHALLRGDGDTLINFWHAVNGLRGFNDKFEKPEWPDIGRRRPDRKKEAAAPRPGRRLIDWGPEPQAI